MPKMRTTLALLAPLLPLATATGNAVIANHCAFPAYAWSVGSTVSGPYTLSAGSGAYSEPFRTDAGTGGRALKVTTAPDGLDTGAPQTIFSYSLDGGSVWYDLSDVFGDAFAGSRLVEASADGSCGVIAWDGGVNPGGSQVKVCGSGSDVTLTLCA